MLFWDVDTQIDFLRPDGHLYVPGSEKILPHLRLLTTWAGDHHIPLISSACAHHPGDPELKIYGEHCMAGTPGQQKVPETLLPQRFTVPNSPVRLPDLKQFQQVIIEKQAFDFATNPNAQQVLSQFGRQSEIILYGVVTEICVAAAAFSLFARASQISLVTDAIAELDPAKAGAFITQFKGRGGKLVTTEVITAMHSSLA